MTDLNTRLAQLQETRPAHRGAPGVGKGQYVTPPCACDHSGYAPCWSCERWAALAEVAQDWLAMAPHGFAPDGGHTPDCRKCHLLARLDAAMGGNDECRILTAEEVAATEDGQAGTAA